MAHNVLNFTVSVSTEEELRPKGKPLAWMFEEHRRTVLASPDYGDSARRNWAQTERLALGHAPGVPRLKDHPSPAECLRWIAALRCHFKSEGSVYMHWKQIFRLYTIGNGATWCQGNPFITIRVKKPKPSAVAIEGVQHRLSTWLDALPGPRERAFIAADFYLGARRGELLAIAASDVTLREGSMFVSIYRQRPKPGRWDVTPLKAIGNERMIEVPAELRPFLEEVLALGPARVKVGRGGQRTVEVPFLFPFRENDLGDIMARIRAVDPAAFPAGRAFHLGRHTVAVELNRMGWSDERVGHQLGHTTTTTTQTCYLGAFKRTVYAPGGGLSYRPPEQPPWAAAWQPRPSSEPQAPPPSAWRYAVKGGPVFGGFVEPAEERKRAGVVRATPAPGAVGSPTQNSRSHRNAPRQQERRP